MARLAVTLCIVAFGCRFRGSCTPVAAGEAYSRGSTALDPGVMISLTRHTE